MSGPQEDLAVRLAKAIKQRELAKLLESALGGDIRVEGETPRLSVNESIAAEENPQGAPLGVRAKLSFIDKPENKLKYLQEKFGPHNVYNTPSGPAFRDKNGIVKLIDPQTDDVSMLRDIPGDIADLAGPLVRTIPGLMVGILGARAGVSPGTITALQVPADAAGAIAAQEIGGEDLTPGERLTDTIVSAGAGAVPAVAGRLGKALITFPKQSYDRAITKILLGRDKQESLFERTKEQLFNRKRLPGEYKNVEPAIHEGLALEKKIGGPPLAASELVNTDTGHGFYNMLRNDDMASQVIKESDIAKGKALSDYKDKVIRAIARSPDGDIKSGGSVAVRAWKEDRAHKSKLISKTAEKVFDAVEASSGGRPIIPVSNFSSVVEQLKYKFEGNSGADGIISEVDKNVKKLIGNGGILNGEPTVRPLVLSNALSDWLNRSKDESLKPIERSVAHRVEEALRKDLENAVELPDFAGEISQGLQKARTLYKQMKDIEKRETSDLLEKLVIKEGKMQGDTIPEALISRSPLEINNTMRILTKTVPNEASILRAASIEKLLSPADKTGVFNPGTFEKTIRKPDVKSKLLALMGGEPRAKMILDELEQAAKYASRISKRGTLKNQPRPPLAWLSSLSRGVPIAEGMVPGIINKVMMIPENRQLAITMGSPEGRDILFGLAKARGSSKTAVARAIAQLSLIILNESSLADYMDEKEKENER